MRFDFTFSWLNKCFNLYGELKQQIHFVNMVHIRVLEIYANRLENLISFFRALFNLWSYLFCKGGGWAVFFCNCFFFATVFVNSVWTFGWCDYYQIWWSSIWKWLSKILLFLYLMYGAYSEVSMLHIDLNIMGVPGNLSLFMCIDSKIRWLCW